jgi:glutamate 5-kinase
MASKLQSAQAAADVGAQVVIADGRKVNAISRVMSGEDVGTLIGDRLVKRNGSFRGRKRWLAFFHKVSGWVIVDSGAQRAIEGQGYSLLPIGIRAVDGHFPKGSSISVRSEDGKEIARGLTEYSSEDIRRIMGHKTADIGGILGSKDCDEVIHRDNMFVVHSASKAKP